MKSRSVFHGTNGDSILSIMDSGEIRPNERGEIYFAQHHWQDALMYGPDKERRASFVIAVDIWYPETVREEMKPTPGVMYTLVLHTASPITAEVRRLYIRRRAEDGEGFQATSYVGDKEIREALQK